MQESTKTKLFVASAAVLVLAAVISHFVNQPRVASDFENVGEPFYPDFTSSEQATSLEVFAMDAETAARKRFKVAKSDGLWRIPSHENYPAEAAARLATTATSVMGIERASLAGRREADFDRLGVVDPLKEDLDDPESAGQRIRMMDANEKVLVDFIVGKQAEDVAIAAADRPFDSGDNKQTYYYVRRADEAQTYTVPLKIDLSTKFSDWIDPDLLRVDATDLTEVTVRNYTLEEAVSGNPLMPQRALTKRVGDMLELTKEGPSTWQLAGVDDEKETFDSAGVTALISTLEELKIADVRRKATFQGKQMLTADLTLNEDPEFKKNPQQFSRAIQGLVAELEDKGFSLAGSEQKLELVSDNGEIAFGTREGTKYTLHIGAPFEEADQEIKVAGAEDSSEDATDSEDSGDSNGSESNATPDAADEAFDDTSRYMLVRVQLDESLLPNQPVKPVEPVEPIQPEGYEPASEQDAAESDAAKPTADDDASSEDDDASESPAADAPDQPGAPVRNPAFESYDVAMREYEQNLVDFELATTRFEDDAKRMAEQVEAATQRVSELNERFGEWYYVISGENLKALQVTREQLVTAKQTPVDSEGASADSLPVRPDISFPSDPTSPAEPEPALTVDETAPAETDLDEPATTTPDTAPNTAPDTTVTEPDTGSQPTPQTNDNVQSTSADEAPPEPSGAKDSQTQPPSDSSEPEADPS